MCNNYASHVPANRLAEAFSDAGFPLRFEGGTVPNLEPRADIRIGDTAPIVVADDAGPLLIQRPWAWKSPQGRPVFNFRSDGRSFAGSTRCLIPADAFYEFTAAEPGQKRKTKWRFTLSAHPWFWIAGLVKHDAWAMLTTEPGPDIAPYHDRQIVVLTRDQAREWLDLTRPEAELLAPTPAGALAVEKVFP
jgi:putative SOS response-associated peptidase YedK